MSSEEAGELRKTVNNILEACGDLMIRVDMEPSRRVANPAIDTSALDARILEYQRALDKMELLIRRGLEVANKPAPEGAKSRASSASMTAGARSGAGAGSGSPAKVAGPAAAAGLSQARDPRTAGEALAASQEPMPDLDVGGIDGLGDLGNDTTGFGDLLGQPGDDGVSFFDYNL